MAELPGIPTPDGLVHLFYKPDWNPWDGCARRVNADGRAKGLPRPGMLVLVAVRRSRGTRGSFRSG